MSPSPRSRRPHRRSAAQGRRATTAPRRTGAAQGHHGADLAATRRRHPTSRPGPPRKPGDRSSNTVGLLVVVTALVLLGLVMVLSAASVSDLREEGGSAWTTFGHQLAFAGLGAGGLVLAMRTHYDLWRRLAVPLLGVTFVALAAVLVPGLGEDANGATRWLGVGPFGLQPSEVAKLALVVWAAHLLAHWSTNDRVPQPALKPILWVLAAVAALFMAQPNLGTTVIAVVAVGATVFVSGIPLWRVAAWGLLGAIVAAALALAEGYRRARVLAFLDPWADPLDTGYQNIQSLVGIASGGLTGVGLGASRAKWGFLPYAHTDFIFAILAEELGLVGVLALLGLFGLLGVFGFRTARRARDPFGTLVAAGITTWLVVQAAVNIGAVVGLLPITGVPLPFVSYGGTALVVNLTAAGVLLSVARHNP